MLCPFCQKQETKVTDSRLSEEGAQVRRRRECLDCGERFTTYEKVELTLPRVIKRDTSRELFSEKKLRRGLLRALEKRAVATENVENTIQQLLQKAYNYAEREIPSYEVGEWIMEELKQLDVVAYVRFASVYRSFKTIDEFQQEITKLSTDSTAHAT